MSYNNTECIQIPEKHEARNVQIQKSEIGSKKRYEISN